MNIKSLILGSAAALVGVSGAQAADAIIAEPEPVEYVRVCDAYGAGFFYIPGTETCLSISGYVFYEIAGTSRDRTGTESPSWVGGVDVFGADEEYTKYLRARVNIDTRSETEMGTLRGYIRLQTDTRNTPISTDAGVVLDQAWLSLGGLLMGYTESAFHNSNLVGSLSNGTGFSWYPTAYGYSQRQLIQYNFTGGNGLFAVVSLENDPNSGNYMPDVVGKIGVQQAWGAAWLTAAFDEEAPDSSVIDGDSEFAIKAGLHLNIPNMPGSAFRLVGQYNSGPNAYGQSGLGNSFSSEWSVYAGYRQQFSPTLAAFVGGQYYSDIFAGLVETGTDAFHVETGVIWTPVTNFEVRAEAIYTDRDINSDGTVSGFLRFTRYF